MDVTAAPFPNMVSFFGGGGALTGLSLHPTTYTRTNTDKPKCLEITFR